MSDTKTQEEFDQEMAARRASQGITSDNVVPEQRPQAFNTSNGEESELEKRRREAGDFDPAEKSAYDKAASKSQLTKAEKAEKKLGSDNLQEGAVVRVLKGIYEGAVGTITKVNYLNADEAAKAASGVPGAARTAKAESYMVRSRGGAHALISVKSKDVELVPGGFTNSQSVI